MSISFHFQQIKRPDFFEAALLRNWLKAVAKIQDARIEELHYIFVRDETLLQINQDYLHHNTYTDIITFNNSESDEMKEGDIFISMDRVIENAKTYKTTHEKELIRVMAHGFLHLIGFNDKTPKEKKTIRAAEEDSIRLYLSIKRKNKKTVR